MTWEALVFLKSPKTTQMSENVPVENSDQLGIIRGEVEIVVNNDTSRYLTQVDSSCRVY